MNKPKREVALFDLLAEDSDDPKSLRVPRGLKKPTKGIDQSALTTGRRAQEQAPVRARSSSAPSDPSRSDPFCCMDGERIRLSFNSFTAGIAIFAVMVVLFGAYEWGRRSGDFAGFRRGHVQGRRSYAAEAMGEIAQARRQEPATHLVNTLLDDESLSAGRGGSAGQEEGAPIRLSGWVQGYTYLVAQEFGAERHKDAHRAKEFLATQGVFTELVTFATGSMQLITAQGYDLKDSTQRVLAEELKSKVRDIGRAYYAAGGGYKLEGYFKTLKNQDW